MMCKTKERLVFLQGKLNISAVPTNIPHCFTRSALISYLSLYKTGSPGPAHAGSLPGGGHEGCSRPMKLSKRVKR